MREGHNWNGLTWTKAFAVIYEYDANNNLTLWRLLTGIGNNFVNDIQIITEYEGNNRTYNYTKIGMEILG